MAESRPRVEQVLDVFDRHRTVRHYTPAKIPAEDLARILEAGRRAPSDATGFMYTVVRVSDRDKREQVERLTGSNKHILKASDFFVVCLDLHRQGLLLERLGAAQAPLGAWAVLFGITDAVLVAENMAVAAEALGYGTGFIGGIQRDALAVAKLLGCPRGVFPVVGLTVGVVERVPEPRKRLPLGATFHEDAYHEPSPAELDAFLAAMRSESGTFDWAATLKRYFAEGGEMHAREPIIRDGLRAQGLDL